MAGGTFQAGGVRASCTYAAAPGTSACRSCLATASPCGSISSLVALGPGSGFESLSVVVAGVWNFGIFPLWDRARKTRFWNGLADKRSTFSVSLAQIGFFCTIFLRFLFPYMSNIHESCQMKRSGNLEMLESGTPGIGNMGYKKSRT